LSDNLNQDNGFIFKRCDEAMPPSGDWQNEQVEEGRHHRSAVNASRSSCTVEYTSPRVLTCEVSVQANGGLLVEVSEMGGACVASFEWGLQETVNDIHVSLVEQFGSRCYKLVLQHGRLVRMSDSACALQDLFKL